MTLHRRSPKHPHLGPEVKMQRMLRILLSFATRCGRPRQQEEAERSMTARTK